MRYENLWYINEGNSIQISIPTSPTSPTSPRQPLHPRASPLRARSTAPGRREGVQDADEGHGVREGAVKGGTWSRSLWSSG